MVFLILLGYTAVPDLMSRKLTRVKVLLMETSLPEQEILAKVRLGCQYSSEAEKQHARGC